jgi:nitrogenase molybdenum-iron protein NifN
MLPPLRSLGASSLFRHSQLLSICMEAGRATYIRRYTISHFRETVDIASSSFGEEATVFGGKEPFYRIEERHFTVPSGHGWNCQQLLSETIGEDVSALIREFRRTEQAGDTELVFAPTPSYVGSHYDGFHRAVYATVKTLAGDEGIHDSINIFPNMVSPEDIRHLKDICADFSLDATILPDYSETLDGESWAEYRRIPEGGTKVEA